jgi:hypothetical protein
MATESTRGATYEGLPCNRCGNRTRSRATRRCVPCNRRWAYASRDPAIKAERKRRTGTPCDICWGAMPTPNYDEKDGVHRGWLCGRCNLMLGHALDNPDTLNNAARYIQSAHGYSKRATVRFGGEHDRQGQTRVW